MTAEPQDVEAPTQAPRHLERRRYKRTGGEQLDYVREAVPHHVDEVEAGKQTPASTPAPPPQLAPPPSLAPSPPLAAPLPVAPTRPAAPRPPAPRPETPPQPAASTDSFTGGRFRAPIYNPGGRTAADYASSSRRSGSSQQVVTRRRRRSGAGRLVALGVLVALGLAGWQAYPTVHAKAVDWAHEQVTDDLTDVAAAQTQYHGLYGRYTQDLTALTLASGVDDVQVVSAEAGSFCLRGSPVVGPQVWFTPATGQTSTPCV
ncbi:hypothetical protein [Kineococcus sp. NPDC059986]|uniref:hypothetical protein n=1 Tax=Kineococcus sp. NPDC059986 TaxID=3155538 RepID=UPI00344DCC0A